MSSPRKKEVLSPKKPTKTSVSSTSTKKSTTTSSVDNKKRKRNQKKPFSVKLSVRPMRSKALHPARVDDDENDDDDVDMDASSTSFFEGEESIVRTKDIDSGIRGISDDDDENFISFVDIDKFPHGTDEDLANEKRSPAAEAKLAALKRTRPKVPQGAIIVPTFTEEEEEIKSHILQFLPDEFDHLFISVKKLADDLSKWEVYMKTTMKTEEEIKLWIKVFEEKSKTKWIVGRNYRPSLTYRKDMMCQHSSKNKSTNPNRVRQRSYNCNRAKIIMKINNLSYWAKYRNPVLITYPSEVTIINDHTHTIGSQDALTYLRPGHEIRSGFLEFFRAGLGPVEALKYHKEKILKNVPDADVVGHILADASLIPRTRTVYYWYRMWKKEHQSLTSEKMTEMLNRRIPLWKERGFDVKATVSRYESEVQGVGMVEEEVLAVAILSPLMKRAHENLAMVEDLVFVDSTGEDYLVTLLQTVSSAGAAPIGMLITYGDHLVAYEKAFELYRELIDETFGQNAFLGQKYPSTFLTSNDSGIRHGLKRMWPEAEVKLISGNAAQFVWSWITDPNNGIDPQDFPDMMRGFMGMLRADDLKDFSLKYRDALEVDYPRWEEFLQSCCLQREDWCWIDRNVETRRNTFAESTLGIYRSIVTNCERDFGVSGTLALLESLMEKVEDLYEGRYAQFLNLKGLSVKLDTPVLVDADNWQIQRADEDLFVVWTESDPCFVIASSAVCTNCSWSEDLVGFYCMHISAVASAFPDLELPACDHDPTDCSIEELLRADEVQEMEANPFGDAVESEEPMGFAREEEEEPKDDERFKGMLPDAEDAQQRRVKELKRKFLREFEEKLDEFGGSEEGLKELEKLKEKLEKKGVEDVVEGVLESPSVSVFRRGASKKWKP